MKTFLAACIGVCLYWVGLAHAQEDAPRLSFPADCRIGEACWVFSFVDLDPGDGYTDHQCGARTYAGHQGTDIALVEARRPEEEVGEEIAVLAAAPGRILGLRDGEADNSVGQPVAFTPGKDCGNGVRIDHGGGWTTQYCHLKRGSIAVKPGALVETGTVLGSIGSSGNSETPHLHFQLERNGDVVDPFTGLSVANPGTCGTGEALWDAAALQAFGAYQATFIRHAAFTDKPLEVQEAQGAMPPAVLSRKAEALIFYATIYGVPKGSPITLHIEGPDGQTFTENTSVLDVTRARRFDFVGRRTPAQGWPAGTYTGTVTIGDGTGYTRRASVVLK